MKAIFAGMERECYVPSSSQWTASSLSFRKLQVVWNLWGGYSKAGNAFCKSGILLIFWMTWRVTDHRVLHVLFKKIGKRWLARWSTEHLWCTKGMLCCWISSCRFDRILFTMYIQYWDYYLLTTRRIGFSSRNNRAGMQCKGNYQRNIEIGVSRKFHSMCNGFKTLWCNSESNAQGYTVHSWCPPEVSRWELRKDPVK